VRSLTHYPISITHSGDEFVISQSIGDTADDVITIRLSEDQASQISKFLAGKDKPVEAEGESPELADGFAEFWTEYPRKDSKARAFDLWKRQRLHAQRELVMTHLRTIKVTEQWTRDGGKFVPHAATYLSQKRYLDEIETEDVSAWT
jgi:hypothetical protein